MSRKPIAAPHSEGRVFGTDWSIAHVATLLRANASRGSWRSTNDSYAARINQNYLRTVSARHLPTGVTLIFMRLEEEKCWYASLCFATGDDYAPWNDETAELWLWALFDAERPRITAEPSSHASVRQFTLPVSPG